MRIRFLSCFISLCLVFTLFAAAGAEDPVPEALEVYSPAPPEINAPSGLLMEQSTGEILFEKNSHEELPIASVTKIMTILLAVEAIEDGKISLNDETVCSEKVSKMEGSKVFLSYNEKISINDLLKSIVVASGNDASVAMAEYLCGNEETFVALMNERARELKMTNTNFMNCTGLDAEGHYSTARDVAIMARELLNHEMIYEYTTIWMDSLRDGKFVLNNTNKLIRFYDGATGLKTGSTSVAKNCIAASAKRDDMDLIAVILRADTSDKRFADARGLLDFGFANYEVARAQVNQSEIAKVPVIKGKAEEISVMPERSEFSMVVQKGAKSELQKEVYLADDLQAPVDKGQTAGVLRYYLNGEQVGEIKLLTTESVECLGFLDAFSMLLSKLLMTC